MLEVLGRRSDRPWLKEPVATASHDSQADSSSFAPLRHVYVEHRQVVPSGSQQSSAGSHFNPGSTRFGHCLGSGSNFDILG